jgi:N utilization substance protein B
VNAGVRARSMARRLAVQALYQLQLNELPLKLMHKQYAQDPEAERADREYFGELLKAIAGSRPALDEAIARCSEIAPADLDPVEHAVLWLGFYELQHCPQLPFRVVLSEAVQLARQFGATDGHKFVNAVLDRAAKELRPAEYGEPR